jgi:hypothetical protein
MNKCCDGLVATIDEYRFPRIVITIFWKTLSFLSPDCMKVEDSRGG